MGQGFFGFMQPGDKPDRPDEPRLTPMEWVWRKLGIKAKPVTGLTTAEDHIQEALGRPTQGHEPPPGGWGSAGMGRPGAQAATFGYSEAPADPVESRLSDVLEDDKDIPRNLFMRFPEQVRLLSRLAFYGKWEAVHKFVGDPDKDLPTPPPEMSYLMEDRPGARTPTPGSSRAMTYEQIKEGLRAWLATRPKNRITDAHEDENA